MSNNKHNILFIVNDRCVPNTGGVGRITSDLCSELAKVGFYVAVLYTNRAPLAQYSSISTTFDEYAMPTDKKYQYDAQCWAYYQNLLTEKAINCIILQTAITDNRYCFFEQTPKHIQRIAAIHTVALHRIYSNASTTEYNTFHSFKSFVWRMLWHISMPLAKRLTLHRLHQEYKHLATLADKIVVLDECYKEQIVELFNLPSKLITVIPNFSKCTIEPQKKKEKILLYVGRMVQNPKNPLAFIRIWKLLESKHPDWEAIMVGDGEDMEKVQSEAKDVERLTILGACDPTPYYKRASILCIPSFTESFGIVAIESLAYACEPVMFDGVSPLSRLCRSAKDFDDANMANTIDECIQNPKDSTQMQDLARNYTPEKIIPMWISLIIK